jgi:glucose/arabinose dehydrogenase
MPVTPPGPYRQGMFVGQHGSWNRAHPSCKVIFVPFDGRPIGPPVDVLTGFMPRTATRWAGRSESRWTSAAASSWPMT